LKASAEAGISWLDTSENYLNTENETLIGEALRKVPDAFSVATKAAPGAAITGGGSGFRPEQIHSACRGSLRRLQRDVIDIYFLHFPDESGVPLEDTWGAMAELVEQGFVRAIGISNYELSDILRCHNQRRVDAIQTGLSIIDYLDDRPLVSACGEAGIAVTIYEPLASGALTGLTLDEIRRRWSGVWEETSFYKRLLSPGRGERSIAVADRLRPIADHLHATVAQVAIAWVLHQPGVTAAIAGSRDGKHMRENAGGADLDLSEVLDEIEDLIPLGPSFFASGDAQH
jgi:aryl-alcohol dehydrogenase-like predicted oxidoreductase